MQNLKILIFCGIDGSGKSTIIRNLNKKTKYKYFCIDRFFDSAYVYDKLTRRRFRETSIAIAEMELLTLKFIDVYLINCKCKYKEILKRLKIKKEDKNIVSNIPKAIKLYKQYVNFTPLNTLVLDTDKYDVNNCVKKIIKFVED